ncbi:hypothetical protein [Actinoplanes utahensis]|uniref:hypothetical protein n=1 Tax=Actinoplanes utahensis TaxID=1869 RepID=UPI0006913B53|nr:hypothetical protein [Actinoplanes utahensis]GIF34182.1 hypothetical protein Aut01nite_71680 [Actinoplanes utahensis]
MNVRLLALAAPLLLTGAAPAPGPAPDTAGAFLSYDRAVVPAGARARLTVHDTETGVRVNLLATGLKPRHAYGAHLHTSRCGKDPADAGPHYQHSVDPAAAPGQPSVDPAFANPRNEIWLDFTTDAFGTGKAVSVQEWPFDESRPPWSLVLHAEHTHTAPGQAGTAGPRLACLTRDGIRATYQNRPGRG